MTEPAFVNRPVDAEQEGRDGVLQERVADCFQALQVYG